MRETGVNEGPLPSGLGWAESKAAQLSGESEKDAREQALFREVNEQIEQLAVGFVEGRHSYICECAKRQCTEPMELTCREYEAVREHANRFVVLPGHENAATETVVEQHDRYSVVETIAGEAARIARETEPRPHTKKRHASPDAAGPRRSSNGRKATDTRRVRPQLLFFYSSTSGSSRRVEGFLAQVLQRRRNHDAFLLHRIDADRQPNLVERFHVDQIPTLIVVADKRVQARLPAPRGCAEIERALAPWLN
jgi:hypothetical protein